MKPQTILIFSLVCNLVLASVAYRYLRPNGARPNDAPTSQSSGKQSSKGKNESSNSNPVRKLVVTNYNTDEFTWHNVEAQDYKDYIANLRSVDCPEETIRDIIVADVNKLYAKKFREMRSDSGGYKYWETQRSWGSKKGIEMQKQNRLLEKEKSALLKELLGVDPNKEKQKELGGFDYWGRMLAFLPEEKQDKMRELQEKYQERNQEIWSRGEQDDEDRKALKQIRAEQEAEMAQFMSPQEIEEYQLRASQTASQLRYDLDAFDPNEREFRDIFAIRKQREDDLAYVYDQDDKEAQKKRNDAVKQTNDQIKNLLGEERYKEYSRAQDYAYKELVKIAEKQELSKETAVAVYDMKKVAEDEATKVRNDKTLTKEQRTAALKAIQTETEKQITASLTEKGVKRYKSRGGYWIQNLGR